MKFANKRLPERATSAVFRYGAAVLLVIAAALITNPLARRMDTTPLFYAAVFISSWYGGLARGQIAAFMCRTDKISSRMDTSDR